MSDGIEISIEGLRELQARLKAADGESQKQLRLVLNDAADIVVQRARPLVPTRSGRARASIRAQSGQRQAVVKGGKGSVPYYPWLDFGGSVGRRDSVTRPFLRDGRFIYPSFTRSRSEIIARLEAGLEAVAASIRGN